MDQQTVVYPYNGVKKNELEFLLWLSGNESYWEPWGCGFDPWPHSVGWGSSIAISCGVGHSHGWDPALLWFWCRPTATALIRSLAWEPPYAAGVAQEKAKTKKKKKKINIQKSVAFQYINNEILEKEYRNTIPFKIAPQKTQHLINLCIHLMTGGKML